MSDKFNNAVGPQIRTRKLGTGMLILVRAPVAITPTDFTGRNTANAWLVASYQLRGSSPESMPSIGPASNAGSNRLRPTGPG